MRSARSKRSVAGRTCTTAHRSFDLQRQIASSQRRTWPILLGASVSSTRVATAVGFATFEAGEGTRAPCTHAAGAQGRAGRSVDKARRVDPVDFISDLVPGD